MTSLATAASQPFVPTPRSMHWITVAVLDPAVIDLTVSHELREHSDV